MSLKGRKVGVAFTGSFCTYKKVFDELQKLADEGAEIQTIFSDAAKSIDSRFGNAEDFVAKARSITGKEPMLTIPQAEPAGYSCYPALHRQYHSQTCQRHHRYTCPHGSQGTSQERKTAAHIHLHQ